jgi:hypothetical protein
MNVNLTPFVVIWACFGIVTLGLALYRKLLSMREDDYLHVSEGQAKLVQQQVTMAERLSAIDKWGKTLTIATLVLGLAIAGAYLYMGYMQSLKPIGG